jgi:hypothetical protein
MTQCNIPEDLIFSAVPLSAPQNLQYIHLWQAFFLAMFDPKSGGIKVFQNIGNCSPKIQYNIPRALIPLQETP